LYIYTRKRRQNPKTRRGGDEKKKNEMNHARPEASQTNCRKLPKGKGPTIREKRRGKNHGNRLRGSPCTKDSHPDNEQRSPKTSRMLGLSFTGRIHLIDMPSISSITFEGSWPPARSLSIQFIRRPS